MSFFDTADRRTETAFTFLQGMVERDWSKIFSFGEMRDFRAGETLVATGDVDRSFDVLMSGSVEVVQQAARLGQMERGEVFGEVAFFDGQPRSATIRALESGTALRFSREAFDKLAAWEPVLARRMLLDLGHAVAFRLRAAERRAAR